MTEPLRKISTIFVTAITIFTIVLMPVVVEASTPEEDLQKIQQQLQEIRNKKNNIQKDINSEKAKQDQYNVELYSLKDQIDLLDTQIEEKQLSIQELQLKIQILENQVNDAIINIADAEVEINDLQRQTDNRLVDMYVDQKTSSGLDLFFSSHSTDIVKLDLYQTSIQDQTNLMLSDLGGKKTELATEKSRLEEDKLQVERDESSIQEEEIALEKDKATIAQQRDIYYRKRNESLAKVNQNKDTLNLLTDEEQKTMAEQVKLEQIVFDRINAIPSGSFVKKGTIIGQQGCTGYCTGPHLHFAVTLNGSYQNPCNVLPAGHLPGCGSGSTPLGFPMQGSYVLTRSYGWSWGSFHYGIDIANYNAYAAIYATHDGWMYAGFEPCSSSNPLCKAGGANYKIICENKSNCKQGYKTMYWHLRS